MSDATIQIGQIKLGARPNDKIAAIHEAGDLMASAGLVSPAYRESLLKRENVSNTYIGYGVAIPHGMIEDRHLIRRTGIVALQIPEGLEWNPGQRVHLVVAIAAQSDEHIALLRRLTRLLQDETRMQQLFTTSEPETLMAILNGDAAPVAAPAAPEAEGDLPHHFRWTLDYPNGLHARPAATWVATARRFDATLRIRHGNEAADAKKLVSLLQLGLQQGDVLDVSADGPDGAAALSALGEVMARVSAQESADAAAARVSQDAAARHGFQPTTGTPALAGIGASPGLAIGVTRRLNTATAAVEDRPAPLTEGGRQLEAALDDTRRELSALAAETARRLGDAAAGIFHAQRELLADSDLITLCCRSMTEQHGVAWSWQQAVEQQAARLEALGNPLLSARAADLRDAGRRVLGKLQPQAGTTGQGAGDAEEAILIARDLAPSDTAMLDTSRVRGLCTAAGGPTSHTAILARTLGLPALVAGGDALLDLPDGTVVILDGDSGRLYPNPNAEDLNAARRWIQAREEQQQVQRAQSALPAQTLDGRHIEIGANLTRPDQVPGALEAGAEGVGLMRTEFLFLERDHAPDEDEQYQVYRAMVDALGGRSLVIRALDIGGDKQVPYLDLPAESNPFLGVRGARLLLRRPDLLTAQLRAVYRAAAHGPVSLMFPMITSVAELIALRRACEATRQALDAAPIPLGIMIEVPAAATLAAQMAAHADFFSIGTNDLTQYALAIDRQHPQLAAEADSLHPAVLNLIKQCVDAAHPRGIKVGVCGALAGDPLGAAILVGLGVDELSMSISDIAEVKARLRASTHSSLAQMAQQAVDCASPDEVQALDGGAA